MAVRENEGEFLGFHDYENLIQLLYVVPLTMFHVLTKLCSYFGTDVYAIIYNIFELINLIFYIYWSLIIFLPKYLI